MSLYIIVAIALFVGVLIEYRDKQTPKRFFLAMFLVLGAMLCLRYGQGTDYFNYRLIYSGMSGSLHSVLSNDSLHSEFGWKILSWCAYHIDLSYSAFVFILSVFKILLFGRFLKIFCKNRFLALFLGYHTLYLTYFFSTLRQGIVLVIFLGLMLDLLIRRKYVCYALLCLVCASLHSIGWLFLAVPILQTRLFEKRNWQLIFVVCAWLIGFVLATGILHPLLTQILPGQVVVYIKRNQPISIFAILERVGTFAVVFFVYWYSVSKRDDVTPAMDLLMRIVTLGFIIYGVFMWQPLIASRLSYPFKVVEIAILSSLLYKNDVFSRLKLIFCTCLVSIMLLKGIVTAINESSYKEHINIFNYPYFTIFNKDAVSEDRFLPSYLFTADKPNRLPFYNNTDPTFSKIEIN